MSILKQFKQLPVGQKIRQVLLMKGMSASDLAERFDMTRQGMAYKLDNNSWDIPEIKKVAMILDVDPKELI